MLKYKSIIEKMSVRRKVALLTDFHNLSDETFNQAGVPKVKAAELSALIRECTDFPSYESAAFSWDTSLIELMTGELAARARGKGVNLLSTPDLKCIVNPYLQGLSEDPVLNAAIAAGMTRAVHSHGAACALNAFFIKESHTEYLDLKQNPAAVHEFFEKPFLYANEEAPCEAIYTSLDPLINCSSYSNSDFFRSAVNGQIGDLFVVGDSAPNEIDFHDYLSKGAYIGGAELTLNRAIGRYHQLVSYKEEGSITERELQGALDDGSAIEEAALDQAVDKLIDFAFRVNQIVSAPTNTIPASEIGLKIAQESIVLLKNEGLLPLADAKKIALFGDVYEDSFDSKLNIVGEVKGFSPDSLQEALQTAGKADILLVFLSCDPDEEKRTFKLSKDCISRLDALSRTGRRMIAVLKGSMPIDMSFDRYFSAVLIAPAEGQKCTSALSDILTGEVNPSGKLTKTYHDYADDYYSTLKLDKDEEKTRVGSFVGYRYYDTAGKRVRYPFGFGLSYTDFVYSDLRINGDEVSFMLKNAGSRAGCEVAQVYIGRNTKSEIVPKKELKAFVRVSLSAGESRRITLTLPQSKYASFDARTMTECVEEGKYTIFIGSSVKDIRLKGTRYLKGDKRPDTDERASDYLRDVSNIGKGHRKGIERVRSLPKKSQLIVGFGLIALLCSLLTLFITGSLMLDRESVSPAEIVIVSLCAVIALGSAALLIGEKKYRKNVLKKELMASRQLKPETVAVKSSDEIFTTSIGQEKELSEVGSADEPQYFDTELSFEAVFQDLKTFSAERGLLIEENHLRNILSAFTASQLLIVPGKSVKQLNKFCEILGEYLGSGSYADNVENCMESSDLFQRKSNFWTEKTKLSLCFEAAYKAKSYLHIALLRHVTRKALDEAFVTLVNDLSQTSFESGDKSSVSQASFHLPPNVWIIAALDEGESLNNIPQSVAEVAAVLDPVFEECEISKDKTLVKPFGYYQFSNLRRIVREEFPLEERYWKRVDRLEERIGEGNGYRISNRVLIKMERHISTFLACGGDLADALDAAIAAELLARIVPMIKPENEAEKFISVLEEIFASSELAFCRKILKPANAEIWENQTYKGEA